MTITNPTPELARDHFGRPMVTPVGGGKPTPYTRCTTYIDVLSDKFNLQQWEKRMVAIGLAARPDLLLSVSAHLDDKGALNRLCGEAKEAAAASAAATTGTALHALTELIDRGQDLPPGLPAHVLADLEAYRAATKDLKATHIEQFMVLDTLKIGGTPDRVVSYKGKKYIADLKTGSIEWDTLKIAMQLAVYSRSKTYDIATGTRDTHNAELDKGLVIHLPAGEATCRVYWIDLLEGWNAVLIAKQVREKRAVKFRDLTIPFEGSLEVATPSLAEQIAACGTADDVRALWAANASGWSDELTAAAKAHIESLPTAS